MPAIPSLEINDFLPRFQLLNHRGRVSDLFRHALGKPIFLVFARGPLEAAAPELLTALAGLAAGAEAQALFMMVTERGPEENAALAERFVFPFLILSDNEGQLMALLPAAAPAPGEGRLSVVLTDANRRVLKIEPEVTGPAQLEALLDGLGKAAPGAAEVVRPIAPVLYVPRVLDRTQCQSLIDLYHSGGSAPTGIKRDAGEQFGGHLDSEIKVRRDHVITDPQQARPLGAIIGKRIVTEIFKAFSFRVKYVKEFKISCYGAEEKGFFLPHRDNYSETGGRRFAMSLNLNTEDYDGGHLRFPEYGPELYLPATGDAVIFSCYLVHEALPVTRGERFVLLTFFYGDEGEGQGKPG
jgi:predicted 2-oxoglutarate/Fe(II)-dependent dioxygenase YbiX